MKFIWETHGVHAGTGNDHVKHGIDDLEEVVQAAIKKGHPSITFIVHTPRLTGYRYEAERDTDIKFIRGDAAYFEYSSNIHKLMDKYGDKIDIKHGIELEWMGSGLGLQWNRSKVFQADGIDFVIGSVHFASEKIAYDGSPEEMNKLIELRGGVDNCWAGYLEEMIEMVDTSWEIIQVVGHIDLPKLYMPFPECFKELDTSDEIPARKMRILLEKISEYNLALDVNLAGIKKGCGVYPEINILKRAHALGIPVTLGTDAHSTEHLGFKYDEGIEYLKEAGFKYYLSYSNFIPEKRPLSDSPAKEEMYNTLNLAIELLNRRSRVNRRQDIPNFSFGGRFKELIEDYPDSMASGDMDTVSVRQLDKSITISSKHPVTPNAPVVRGVYSIHKDAPGVLSQLFNALASEGINVETAELNYGNDGSATAFLTVSGNEDRIEEALEFTRNTGKDDFIKISMEEMTGIPEREPFDAYITEVDGIDLHIPVSDQMILTCHDNTSGVLLILLSALASVNINVKNLQLGRRGNKAYAVLGVEGDEILIDNLLSRLGPNYSETSHIVLNRKKTGRRYI